MPWDGGTASFREEGQNTNGWNISYTVPEEWPHNRTEGRLKMFMHTKTRSALFVAPAIKQTPQGVANDINNLAKVLNLQVQPAEGLKETTMAGKKVIEGSFDFINNNTYEKLQGYTITVFGQYETSFGMLVLATPENIEMSRKLLEGMVPDIKLGKPIENQNAVAALAGTWVYYSGNSSRSIAGSGSWSHSYQETVYFDGAGNYTWRSSSHVAANSHRRGNSETSASNIGGNNSAGTYTVIDNTLIVNNQHGSFAYDIQLHGGKLVSGGRTFLRE